MKVPFTREEFFDVFARYNEAVWPVQWLLYGLALISLVLAVTRFKGAGRWVSSILAFLWAWTGVAYHLLHFSSINAAAMLFGGAYVVQAGVFVWFGTLRNGLSFGWPGLFRGVAAVLVVAYALVAYPALNALLGHEYPRTATFGLPCPTTIFTFGLLFLLEFPFPRLLLVVPILWAAIGGSAAFLLGVPQDLGLVGAGLLGLGLIVIPQRSTTEKTASLSN